jgi:hypothetical protein
LYHTQRSTLYAFSLYAFSLYAFSLYAFSLYAFSLYAFSLYAFSLYAFSLYAFSLYAFSLYAFSLYAFSLYAFSLYAFSLYAVYSPSKSQSVFYSFRHNSSLHHPFTGLKLLVYCMNVTICIDHKSNLDYQKIHRICRDLTRVSEFLYYLQRNQLFWSFDC